MQVSARTLVQLIGLCRRWGATLTQCSPRKTAECPGRECGGRRPAPNWPTDLRPPHRGWSTPVRCGCSRPRPQEGRLRLAAQLVLQSAVVEGWPTWYVCPLTDTKLCASRLMAARALVPLYRILRTQLATNDQLNVGRAREAISAAPLAVLADHALSPCGRACRCRSRARSRPRRPRRLGRELDNLGVMPLGPQGRRYRECLAGSRLPHAPPTGRSPVLR